ncbi:MAG TPA: uroporphyrinogen decarboxylase family protein [Armatimonadota bacterium]
MNSLYDLHAEIAVKRSMGVRREEYLDYMTFRENRRPLFAELYGPLLQLKQEWARQGAATAELDLSAFRYRAPLFGEVPVNTGWLGGQEEVVLEETEETVIGIDRRGRRVKLCKQTATIPLPLEYQVATMADWLRLKEHYEFSEARFGEGWEAVAREQREAGQVVTVAVPGAFWEPRELMGDAALCVAYYEQPELLHDILDTIAETAFRVLDRVTRAVPVDVLTIGEDLAGKSGPLVGPRQMREFVVPYYRRLWDLLAERGAQLFVVDSDGNLEPIIPDFLAGGVNVLQPLEPAAGMDIVRLREQYGTRLAFQGGIDKHVLPRGRAEIATELEYKLPPMIRTGGCVLGLDHRITNGTPLESYRFYLDKSWEIMEREAKNLG